MRKSQFAVFTDYKDATLAFNTLTSEFIRIEMNYSKFMKSIKKKKLPKEINELLITGKFFVNKDSNEFSDFLIKFRNKRYGPQKLIMYISPTLQCNAECVYCYQGKIRPKLNFRTNIDVKHLLKFIITKLYNADGLKVSWYGGEPLLKSKFIEEISVELLGTSKLVNKPYSASIVTNGLLLNKKNIAILQNANINNIQISLDGAEEIHNKLGRKDKNLGFKQIIDNIKTLPDTFNIGLRINVNPINITTIPNLIEYLSKEKLNDQNIKIDFPLIYNYNIGDNEAKYQPNTFTISHDKYANIQILFYAFAKKNGFNVTKEEILIPGYSLCHAIRSKGYSIWPNGLVTKCIHEISTPELFSISDHHLDITHVTSLQKWLVSEFCQSNPCKSCFYLPICGGGCYHARFSGTNPPQICPAGKYNLKQRMQWYESIENNEDMFTDITKHELLKQCKLFTHGRTT